MAQEYASNKPQSFKNHVENIAIVGVAGQVGKYIVEELSKTGKHKITAITRTESTSKVPKGIEVKKVNYDDPDSLVEALRGQEVLIITMAVTAPPEQQTKLIEAAAAANVPWVIPNEWGYDGTNNQLGKDTLIGEAKVKSRAHIEQLGNSSWIAVACGFWYEYSLSFSADTYGFDFKNRAVTFFDDGNTRINTSTWPQCGRGVAGLLGLKVLPDDENDKTPNLTQFRSRFVHMSSFLVSQKDMLHSVMRVTGTKLEDWKITHEPSNKRYESALAELQRGNRMAFGRLLYARVFYPDGSGDFESSKGLQNGIMGLPKEDIDEYTKLALQMAEAKVGSEAH
ncbi:MAG: hypothetical protein M1827_007168 [Pycnora praestabilis]|nr:MAG: hypothetical protein M1827_007168 [Pycnora praestabilis]